MKSIKDEVNTKIEDILNVPYCKKIYNSVLWAVTHDIMLSIEDIIWASSRISVRNSFEDKVRRNIK